MLKKVLPVFCAWSHMRKIRYAKCSAPRIFFISKRSFSANFNSKSTVDDDVDSLLEDPEYEEMVRKVYRQPNVGHKLLVIQPRVKVGPNRITKDSAELKLAEAIALVETLVEWEAIDKCIIPVTGLKNKLIFGKGNLESIRSLLRKWQNITGIFIGVDLLTALQNASLEKYFKVQIFDRYQIVLQIFHHHARTKEAKLQIALAEIPYLRVKLCEFSHTFNSDHFSGIHHVGGAGETFMETRRRLLLEREIKLKRALDKVQKQRNLLRQNDKRKSYPIVAVVGYTNCGKTTLIKALTQDGRLKPENKLFATLDVTLHAGFLPSSQKVLYVDTVGFISDVPTDLIAAFRSTLEDVALADIIVHVRDISNPDSETQKAVVLETLKSLSLPDSLMDSILEVGNKIDLLDESDMTAENFIPISATEGINLQHLSEIIEEGVLKNTGHCLKYFRVPNGGEEYRWLYKEAALKEAVADEKDPNYLLVEVVISQAAFGKFIHRYGDLLVSLPNEVQNS